MQAQAASNVQTAAARIPRRWQSTDGGSALSTAIVKRRLTRRQPVDESSRVASPQWNRESASELETASEVR